MLRKDGEDPNQFKISRRGKTLDAQAFELAVTSKRKLMRANDASLIKIKISVALERFDFHSSSHHQLVKQKLSECQIQSRSLLL